MVSSMCRSRSLGRAATPNCCTVRTTSRWAQTSSDGSRFRATMAGSGPSDRECPHSIAFRGGQRDRICWAKPNKDTGGVFKNGRNDPLPTGVRRSETKVNSCAETPSFVDESRLERIRHQCQKWPRTRRVIKKTPVFLAPVSDLPDHLVRLEKDA